MRYTLFSGMLAMVMLCLYSCRNKTDIKSFTDGIITVEAFTAIRPEVQSSDKNICIIKARKQGEAAVLVSFSSYGLNNVNVSFQDRQILIRPLDPATAEELSRATDKAREALNYQVVFQDHDPQAY